MNTKRYPARDVETGYNWKVHRTEGDTPLLYVVVNGSFFGNDHGSKTIELKRVIASRGELIEIEFEETFKCAVSAPVSIPNSMLGAFVAMSYFEHIRAPQFSWNVSDEAYLVYLPWRQNFETAQSLNTYFTERVKDLLDKIKFETSGIQKSDLLAMCHNLRLWQNKLETLGGGDEVLGYSSY